MGAFSHCGILFHSPLREVSLTARIEFRIFFDLDCPFLPSESSSSTHNSGSRSLSIPFPVSNRIEERSGTHVWLHKGVIPLLIARRPWTFPQVITVWETRGGSPEKRGEGACPPTHLLIPARGASLGPCTSSRPCSRVPAGTADTRSRHPSNRPPRPSIEAGCSISTPLTQPPKFTVCSLSDIVTH